MKKILVSFVLYFILIAPDYSMAQSESPGKECLEPDVEVALDTDENGVISYQVCDIVTDCESIILDVRDCGPIEFMECVEGVEKSKETMDGYDNRGCEIWTKHKWVENSKGEIIEGTSTYDTDYRNCQTLEDNPPPPPPPTEDPGPGGGSDGFYKPGTEPPVADCAGVVGGSAFMADCGCIGGDTGIENCPSPPPPPPSEPPFDPYNDPYVGDGQGTGDPSFDDLNNITVAPDEPVIDNGVELEEPSILTPASTLRLIGSTRDRNPATGLAPDMQHGFSGDLSGIFWTDYTNRVEYPDSRLFVMMSALMSHCSFLDSDMKLVAGEMVKRFHENQSENTQFSDPVLNSRVFNSSAFKNFMKLFGKELNEKLSNSGGNIGNVQIDMDGVRPIFNGLYNKFHGLQIMINDTQKTEIYLENFSITPTNYWNATVTVKIYDNFGLDHNDVINFQNKHHGFIAWYLLQHQRNYIPFETVVTVRVNIGSHF